MKKIVVPRSTTIFLLFSIVLLFGLLLIFTFEVLLVGCLVYIFLVPVSIYRYLRLKKKFATSGIIDDDEPEDVL